MNSAPVAIIKPVADVSHEDLDRIIAVNIRAYSPLRKRLRTIRGRRAHHQPQQILT
ncbi:hypothetical protein [Nitrosovibrio tenuis]|uniref:hypothetical protein n=1 Tax=Nitrosovibrio tenuis TaxID=1233 RepID=UPI0015A6E369|nr:hypothetical protein [Nitrosovibrio tenuis]